MFDLKLDYKSLCLLPPFLRDNEVTRRSPYPKFHSIGLRPLPSVKASGKRDDNDDGEDTAEEDFHLIYGTVERSGSDKTVLVLLVATKFLHI